MGIFKVILEVYFDGVKILQMYLRAFIKYYSVCHQSVDCFAGGW